MKYIYTILLTISLNYLTAQVPGCTDPLSRSYNPEATVNDGSCTYTASSVSAATTVNLPGIVNETSGLIIWDGSLYTHNDNTDISLYSLSAGTGLINEAIPMTGTTNQDWEDVGQDDNFVYIAETGNNVNGNRTNLRIIRADKAGLITGSPTINSINFTYSNQTDFTATGNNNTDFDCEAMIVGTDSIYLFTKQWVSRQTSVYSIPKTPGTHVAQLLNTFNVSGLVTGATYLEDKRLVALCGYSTTLQPFIYLLYDFQGNDFFGGNKRKLSLSLGFHQIEGIATENGTDYYLTNENFQQSFINTPQRLHTVNLADHLSGYLQTLAAGSVDTLKAAGIIIFPNPAQNFITVQCPQSIIGRRYNIVDVTGRNVQSGLLSGTESSVDISALSAAIYSLVISGFENDGFRLVKNN